MEEIEDIKNYLQKLQRVIKNQAEFKFIDLELIKKEKIDDVLCCLLAVLPKKYKDAMKQKQIGQERLNSIVCYNALFAAIKRKFLLNKSVYLVESKKAIELISTILACIEKDIKHVENSV